MKLEREAKKMKPETPAAKKPNYRHSIYEAIKTQIIDLSFAPGTLLSENQLAASLGVSRTPIREALLLLNRNKLVEIVSKKGTFTTLVDISLVREAQFLREALEISALQSLSYPLNPQQVETIKTNLEQQKIVAAKKNPNEFFPIDEEFHQQLMALSGHENLWSSIREAKVHLDRARMIGFKATPPLEYYCQHRDIFYAVQTGDIAQASQLLARHLRRIFDDIHISRQKLPQYFTP